MARAARLKVFVTSAGFDDALVAAPSRKAALEAWGARGDLFALGEAREVNDPAIAAPALERPGEVVRRPRGDVSALLADAPRRTAARPPPDRGALDAAEAALAAASTELDDALSEIAREQKRLEAREAEVRRAAEKQLAALRKARDAARGRFDAAAAASSAR